MLGLNTYKFVQEVPTTKIAEIAGVPRSALKLPGEGSVTVDASYASTRTIWVEPLTGAIINASDKQYSTLKYEGEAADRHRRDVHLHRRDGEEERGGRGARGHRRDRRRLPGQGRTAEPDQERDPADRADPRRAADRAGRLPGPPDRHPRRRGGGDDGDDAF